MLKPARYQLIVLGAEAARLRDPFVESLSARLEEIGDGLGRALEVFGPDEIGNVDRTAPASAVYFGSDTSTDASEAAKLVSASVPILPVVYNLDRYSDLVAPALRPVNGLQVHSGAPDFAALTNLVLENLSLLRRSRRLFLSYRRHESTPVAHQLRVAFDALGYDAFLDTNSVAKGDEFQSVLWHRLLDSDVMVVLDTTDFLGSKYTKGEIANAGAMSVGILQVLWPGVVRAPHSTLAHPLQLTAADFAGDELTEAAVARVTSETEALRARCIAARHTNLVAEYCNEAERVGAKVAVQPERFVMTSLSDGRRVAAIPAVGVPDALRYHEASRHFSVGGVDADEALLIYDHRGMLPEWITFLDWLDDFLPVKGLRVMDTAARLVRP